MAHKGHFGVSMGSIVKQNNNIDKSAKNCANCTNYNQRKCSVITKITNGRQTYISDKKSARLCIHFINKHEKTKDNTPNNSKTKNKNENPQRRKKYRYVCDSINRHVTKLNSKATSESRCKVCNKLYDNDVKLIAAPISRRKF